MRKGGGSRHVPVRLNPVIGYRTAEIRRKVFMAGRINNMTQARSMCRIIKAKSDTLALILRSEYVNEVWRKSQPTEQPSPSPLEVKAAIPKETL